ALARARGAAFSDGYTPADLLPPSASSERPRARKAPAHDAHAAPRAPERRARHGARDAGRRPAGSVDAAGVPEPGRVRHGGAGGDRSAPLLLCPLPLELLPPSRDAGR